MSHCLKWSSDCGECVSSPECKFVHFEETGGIVCVPLPTPIFGIVKVLTAGMDRFCPISEPQPQACYSSWLTTIGNSLFELFSTFSLLKP